MSLSPIQAVDLVKGGVVVTYADHSRAFYHESVLQAHLLASPVEAKAPRRKAARVLTAPRMERKSA